MKHFLLSLTVVLTLLGSVCTDLNDDNQDFINLIPIDKIDDIIKKYITNASDVRGIVDFIDSNTFENMFEKFEDLPATQKLLDYLKDSGLPMDEYLKDIKDWIDSITSDVSGDSQNSENSSRSDEESSNASNGIVNLTGDLANIYNQLIGNFTTLYNNKLETSSDFADFIDRIESPTFKNLLDAVRFNNVTNSIIDALFE